MNEVLPQEEMIQHIESELLGKNKWIKEQLKVIDSSDPALTEETMDPEWATNVWEETVHEEKLAEKSYLVKSSDEIKAALERIREGTFGRCEGCLGQIERERLKIISTTTLCVSCASAQRRNRPIK